MRAHEFINEAKTGKMPNAMGPASRDSYSFRDDGTDRTYTLNRVMMAAAMHDGKSTVGVDMPAASFVEKYNTAHPYTKEESNMLKGAMKTVGSKHKTLNKDSRSMESPDVNKTSPVAGFKGYKRK